VTATTETGPEPGPTDGGGLPVALDLVGRGGDAAARGDLAEAIAAYEDAAKRLADLERPVDLSRARRGLLGVRRPALWLTSSISQARHWA
jgi:hypothetical protein